jgi:hypothetical protein
MLNIELYALVMQLEDPAGGVVVVGMLVVRPAAAGVDGTLSVLDMIGIISVAKEQSATDLMNREFDLLLSM